eukprot:Hpha_TRINITY_DN15063_c3_g10::TRINITY_DN15063_c3_g10_i1::g.124087::m.124087
MGKKEDMRARDEARIAARPRIVVPTTVLLVAGAFVSTMVSVGGGLSLYFEGLNVLEDTVRVAGLAESLVATRALSVYFEHVKEESEKFEGLLHEAAVFDMSMAREPPGWFPLAPSTQNISAFLQFQLGVQSALTRTKRRMIHGYALELTPDLNDTSTASFLTYWWDALSTDKAIEPYGGSKMYLSGLNIPTNTGGGCPEPLTTHHCVFGTGHMYDNNEVFVHPYNWSRRKNTFEDYQKKSAQGWSMSNVNLWTSYDNTPFFFTHYSKHFMPMIPGHPDFGGGVILTVWMMLYDWDSELRGLDATGTMIAAGMAQGAEGEVYVSTLGDLKICSGRTYGVSCSNKLGTYHRWVALGTTEVNKTEEGDFIRRNLDGSEYWVTRRVIHQGTQWDHYGRIDLIWLLETSSLEDRAFRSLMMFVLFIVWVVLFDILVLVFEVLKLAQPLRTMSRALIHLDEMELERIDEELASISKRHSILGVSDVQSLLEAFQRAVSSLIEYRLYLPQSVLNKEYDTDDDVSFTATVVPPGVGGGEVSSHEANVAIVFTDIQSSTLLWEADPEGMSEALRIHNATLRRVARDLSGYEVKIIGDALMLAFARAADAVEFGVEAQVRLAHTKWPVSLCEHPLCCLQEEPTGTVLWHGLRVRIGVNWGHARVEINPVTRRYDYFGPTVNTAARVEAALKHGGLTGVTQAAMDEIGGKHGGAFVEEMGEKTLKGVAQPVKIYVVLHPTLAGRCQLLQQPMLSGLNLAEIRSYSMNINPLSPSRVSPSESTASRFDKRLSRADPAAARLALRLESSVASCATVLGARFNHTEVTISELLIATETAALRTQGRVVCVVSALYFVCWNAGMPCADHVCQCAHFVGLLQPRLSAHVGAASGPVLAGNIAGRRSRFVTVAGSCVELSVALTQAAAARGVRFMASGDVARSLEADGTATRAGTWRDTSPGATQAQVAVVWATEATDEDSEAPESPQSADSVGLMVSADSGLVTAFLDRGTNDSPRTDFPRRRTV